MVKKLTCVILAVCMMLSMLPTVFAKMDENAQIKAVQKAIDANTDKIDAKNNMNPDDFLRELKFLVPEDCDVSFSFDKESDFRVYNASSEKDGQIFANVKITCGVYTTHHMFTVKMPKFTGDEIAANANGEKLDKDKQIVENAIKWVYVSNSTTKEEILTELEKSLENGSTLEWGEYTKEEAPAENLKGKLKGTIILTLNGEKRTVSVLKVVYGKEKGNNGAGRGHKTC